MNFVGHTQRLERQDQIVCPEDHLHVCGIGPETQGENLGHMISVLEVSKQQLLESPVGVELTDGRQSQFLVGDQDPVMSVAFKSEQMLLDLFVF